MKLRYHRSIRGAIVALLLMTMQTVAAAAGSDANPSPTKIVLAAEQSTGGKILQLSHGVTAVTLDSTSKDAGPEGAAIEWTTPAPLAAGWWHGTLDLSAREGDEKSWVNTHLGIVMVSGQSPMVNMMTNFIFKEKNLDAQQFEFWIYTSSESKGVRLQGVYDGLYHYKRTWPVVGLTLEQMNPFSLGVNDPVTLDLPVAMDGSVALPTGLPPGIWSLRGGMTKDGTMTCQGQDGRDVTGPFNFDRWRRPGAVHFYTDSPMKAMTLKTASMFKNVVLEHDVTRPSATPNPTDGTLITTVDPGKTESAELVMIGTNLSADVPSFPLMPHGKKIAVLTTWDDGKPSDLRCAEILHKHGYRPSFFMNANSEAMKFLDKLDALDVEIGSHCYHHPSLYELPPDQTIPECVAMRKLLETDLKHPVISFAYPNGYSPSYDVEGDYVLRAVRAAGYWSGRTTIADQQTIDSVGDLLTMKSDGFFGNAKDLERVWKETQQKEGGVFYFWGHSWQIGKTDAQWQKFDDFVAQFAHHADAWYASQGEFSLWIWARKNLKFAVSKSSPTEIVVTVTRPWLHPYLSARCPISLKLPAGVQAVKWQGKEVPVTNGAVELAWPSP